MLCFRSLLLWQLILPLSLHMQPPQKNYDWMYGNVVGLEIANVSVENEDVSTAVKVAQSHLDAVFSSDKDHRYNTSVEHITKTRLLYSVDDGLPTLIAKRITKHGKEYIQRTQIVIGLLYTFTIIVSHHSSSPNSNSSTHHFTVTRDSHKQYHIYQHTSQSHDHSKAPTWTSVLENYSTAGDICEGEGLNEKTPKLTNFRSCRPELSVCAADIDSDYQSARFSILDLWPTSLKRSGSTRTSEKLCGEGSKDLNKPLRIATYNIWNTNADEGESYKHRLRRLGKFISSRDVDVFGFQEVRLQVAESHKKTLGQVTQLSHYLPHYQFVFQPAMLFASSALEGGRREEGVAVFSRYPIVASDYILLYRNNTDEEDRHQRICLRVTTDVPHFGMVHVFVTHLSLNEEAQAKSVVEVWRYMEQFSGLKLLMGDLNAEPDSTPIRFLNGEVSLEGLWSTELHDLWSATHTASDKQSGYTFSAISSLVKRIDYIFMQAGSCGKEEQSLCVSNTTIEGTTYPCYEACSDHLALISTLLAQ